MHVSRWFDVCRGGWESRESGGHLRVYSLADMHRRVSSSDELKPLWEFKHDKRVASACFSPDSKLLYVQGKKTVEVHAPARGQQAEQAEGGSQD